VAQHSRHLPSFFPPSAQAAHTRCAIKLPRHRTTILRLTDPREVMRRRDTTRDASNARRFAHMTSTDT
jgi:hypothetical protein